MAAVSIINYILIRLCAPSKILALRGQMEGAHIKNLYLRDGKKKNYLVVASEDKAIDLKELGHRLRWPIVICSGSVNAISRVRPVLYLPDADQ